MYNATKFLLALLASACVFYLLILVAKLYAWIAIPFILLAMVLLWKKDRYIGIGILTAFILTVVTVGILLYMIATMKISF